MSMEPIPAFFHPDQLRHQPLYEWAFGRRLKHPETTRRMDRILDSLRRVPEMVKVSAPRRLPIGWIRRTHHHRLITLYRTAESLTPYETFYPSVFPKQSQTLGDPFDIHQAGYFCFDSGTPLNATTWEAATWSAACAAEAALVVRKGRSQVAYGLCRPPGHHASRDLFGGYCYFNNAAIAAKILKSKGRVAIIDIDFHHGNGTQSIFYRDPEVLFLSVHGNPADFYPFFSGFTDETGRGKGMGFNVNLPLPSGTTGRQYLHVLDDEVLPRVRRHDPSFLVISAGFDTWRGDPIGRFSLETPDFTVIGDRFARLGIPTVIVQEGGYDTRQLGRNVAAFLSGWNNSTGLPLPPA